MCAAAGKGPEGDEWQRRQAERERSDKLHNTVLWSMCAVVATFAASYLAVPLYKIFCTATGATLKQQEESIEKLKGLEPPKDRESRIITVSFDAGTNDRLQA